MELGTQDVLLEIAAYVQQKLKNCNTECDVVDDRYGAACDAQAVIIVAKAYFNDEVYRVAKQTAWYSSERFSLDELRPELDYLTSSISCNLGSAVFKRKEKE